jgi:hypothetical protein
MSSCLAIHTGQRPFAEGWNLGSIAAAAFMASFNAALDDHRHLLADVGAGHFDLPNLNLDTGSKIQLWTYFMQDEAYARLLSNLDREQFKRISPALRSDILTYFRALGLPVHINRDKMEKTRLDWKKVPQEIEELKSLSSDSKLAEGQDTYATNNQVKSFVNTNRPKSATVDFENE